MKYQEYKKTFEKYGDIDTREINFQNELVKPLLKEVLKDADVIDTSTITKGSSIHDRKKYAGHLKNRLVSPDLLICKNWNYSNINNHVNYLAVVEVKSPFHQNIYSKEYDHYSNYLRERIDSFVINGNVKKLILTDALKWEFYDFNNNNQSINTIRLYNMKGRGKWEWRNDNSYNQLLSELTSFVGK
ncbi:TPA: hypothetical protein PQS58_002009 [Staphylococcus aureus]|nr:hypothetical protein [Staphylococcus aureus]